jgi:large-conductance mechanosensitive channel
MSIKLVFSIITGLVFIVMGFVLFKVVSDYNLKQKQQAERIAEAERIRAEIAFCQKMKDLNI